MPGSRNVIVSPVVSDAVAAARMYVPCGLHAGTVSVNTATPDEPERVLAAVLSGAVSSARLCGVMTERGGKCMVVFATDVHVILIAIVELFVDTLSSAGNAMAVMDMYDGAGTGATTPATVKPAAARSHAPSATVEPLGVVIARLVTCHCPLIGT